MASCLCIPTTIWRRRRQVAYASPHYSELIDFSTSKFCGSFVLWNHLIMISISLVRRTHFSFVPYFWKVITSITLFLKQNNLEGLFIGFWIIPTLLYDKVLLEKYSRPYLDAALLQTRRMYSHTGNDAANAKSSLQREEYRRWLVDCHKASYLPTCLSGGKDNLLTSEPAVVTSEGMSGMTETVGCEDNHEEITEGTRKLLKRQQNQKGGILHRQRFNIWQNCIFPPRMRRDRRTRLLLL